MSTIAVPSLNFQVQPIGEPHLVHKKIIYAKRNGLTNKELEAIMQLEISNFVREHPGYEFEKVGTIVKNADQSRTYPLHFKKVTKAG